MKTFLISVLSLLVCASLAWGGDGEALFKEGKFKEAAQAFAEKDMEKPQDVRWRYNRGVASYMAEDMEAAQSAFTSAGLRTDDPEIQFRSAYNLGTTMLKGQDYENAAKQFQKALAIKPQDEDTRENLKLALWRQAYAQKSDQEQQDGQQCPNGDPQKGDQNKQDGQKQDSQDQQKKDGQQQQGEQSQNQDKNGQQGQDQQGQDKQGQDKEQQSQSAQSNDQGQDEQNSGMAQNAEDQEPENLDGAMEAVNKPAPGDEEQQAQARMAAMEKKMAETVLDNVKENRVFRPDSKSAIISDERANSGKRW
ncbi:MAG: hypothetical protein JEZ02_11695 [Desulfatibacillum sp.]|nr:hypothetical protein [Desulfatibacillum sp.]